MKSLKVKKLTIAAMLAAFIFLATTFLKIPIPLSNNGYIHIGDALIFLTASLISPFYALMAASIGATLADIVSGSSVWAPYTFVIKGLMAVLFTYKANSIINKRNIIMAFLASLINITGYYFAEAIIAKNFLTPVASIPLNLIQFFGSLLFFVLLGIALDKVKIKNALNNNFNLG